LRASSSAIRGVVGDEPDELAYLGAEAALELRQLRGSVLNDIVEDRRCDDEVRVARTVE
jgi:hypothetical protein